MGLSKTEVNLKRLLVTAPQQQNQEKLIHYVATLRELLEQLAEEKNPDGLPQVSKAKVNEYAENIEAVAAKLAVPVSDLQTPEEPAAETSSSGTPKAEESVSSVSEGLRRRVGVHSNNEERCRDTIDSDQSAAVKLDDAARAHIEKHRKLQEDLTDEMVILARQLKESSLMMNQSIKTTEKILDSAEKAVEHSLASTGHATSRAMDVYSRSFKTTCFQWLLIFVMTLVFVMVVLLIRLT
ncbi:uncharacterized protein LOC107786363 [Nicotiana tabacum]|uniref:Vesicle transport protein USE1-like n=1 Tax=Nicotiana tabacum TaxID=4097 RepID=A0A1S3ZGB1_TOBAC|nr:PREDICTED: uncharacterized protein LOC107786363 [Nicotiana tabacum]XP_016463317.1 PREDICTED: uncharacterized protein LOC107786363 [Nicotiana tabacum]XP_016463318.1 PREDICTED: uncharacterized protein LOC107786363 [Nicotiana tabacum]XP_016463319.1 PREDICTED: uncharacterized protein LOC107786363 [Nicotiana tabacum]